MSRKIRGKKRESQVESEDEIEANGKLFISTLEMGFRVFPAALSAIFCTETDTLPLFCACIFKSDGEGGGKSIADCIIHRVYFEG